MKKSIVILSVLIVGTIGIIVFINKNNDHVECTTSVMHSVDKNGNDIMTEEHICKEKYNF